MSVVTDIVLITGIDDGREGDEESPGSVDRLNDLIAAMGRETDRLVQVDRHAGGHKAMQCDVWLTALNHTDIEEIEAAFHEIKWTQPKMVQLIINEEYTEELRVVKPALSKGIQRSSKKS